MTSTISETAAFMHQAHKMGISHFNMNIAPIDRDQFDKTFDFPVDLYAELYAELYEIYRKGYRSVGQREKVGKTYDPKRGLSAPGSAK